MSDIIKPCPFCGAEGEPQSINGRWIGCVNVQCRALGPTRDQWSDAIAAWNAAPRLPRATTPPNTVRVRVAVETNKDGFTCVYWVGPQEEVDAPSEPGNRITYASFNAFLPEPAAEIEAEIEP